MVFPQSIASLTSISSSFYRMDNACLRATSFTIHINGQTGQSFKAERGLKQGDPLSPLLFVIVMEYFSRQMKKLSSQQYAFHPGCKALKLTHLMFADDLLIFCKAQPSTLSSIIRVLNEFHERSGLQANQTKSQAIYGGCNSTTIEACNQITGFREGGLPLKYLGITLSSSRLTKIECRTLVDKITMKVKQWSSRSLSFAGRAQLLNSVIFGMYSYWANIFILPHEVIELINKICRNFLWGGNADYNKIPYISWQSTCLPKKHGGIGLKNLTAWNTACIAKLVWGIAKKKDQLWIKWIHHRYLKENDWYWRKIVKVKDQFLAWKQHMDQRTYKVSLGYSWLIGEQPTYFWAKAVWARASLPRHSFISWVFMHQKLPVLSRLAKFTSSYQNTCSMCSREEEDLNHLFFQCSWSKGFWKILQTWWPSSISYLSHQDFLHSL